MRVNEILGHPEIAHDSTRMFLSGTPGEISFQLRENRLCADDGLITRLDRLDSCSRYQTSCPPATKNQGTNLWRSFTTNKFIPLATLNPNLTTGTYSFAVTAANAFGAESPPATLTTNISKPPAIVILIRIEVP